MLSRAINLLLLLLLIVGGFLAWNSGRQRGRLTLRYDQLKHTVGDLPIGDPGLVHVLALPTNEPWHFAWRFYYPPKSQRILRGRNSGSTSWSGSGQGEQFLARVRFRQNDEGLMQVFARFGSGSSLSGFG